ncbi:hypothetical protein SAMD00019534_048610 [Acytostelium subglobosum LB1]|uniref:hypothetical protein n=1 Tax=Acytostelium subglobosum LB1 TaxID=1410327 RepID=UPI0006451563|nr:hypothetical protein SAMD00019534_048610 [Acytostelium subglobosum LB1]GAM21686.1 hypothetical protein SAMD00019534_048610 [Acytostelium subglobosum LB1]|eukprot:XP_012755805.1 hypothetical protein SAMD00019534_048610 [Acytostelium subglobosum LB1]
MTYKNDNGSYYFTPCTMFNDQQPCGALTAETSICEVSIKLKMQKALGFIQDVSEPIKQLGELTLLYSKGSTCNNGVDTTTSSYVTFVCDKQSPGVLVSAYAADDCTYYLQVGSHMFCRSGKLSGGDIFLIVVGSLTGAYFIGGVIVLLYIGERGLDVIPNRQVWCKFFGLVGEGAVYVKCKVTGNTNNKYQSLDSPAFRS